MTLRCPVCRGHLSASDTIEELFVDEEAAWSYHYACGACLSIVAQRIGEISETRPRVEPAPPTVFVSGAVVARAMERLRAAPDDTSLARVVATLVEDPARVLLRVPAVFALARRGYGERVLLAERGCFRFEDASERGRLYRWARDGEETLARGVGFLAAGERLRVVGTDENAFVVQRAERDAGGARRGEPRDFVVPPDLVAPDIA